MPTKRRFLLSALAALALVASGLVLPIAVPAAQAAGTPNVGLTVSMPGEKLLGEPIPVTLTASNPGGPNGFNLGFVSTLPAGFSFTNAAPAPDRVVSLPNGTTRLVWDNVADLQTGTEVAVTFDLLTSPGTAIGANVGITAGAYANSDPRVTPRFSTSTGANGGAAIAASYTGSATGTATTAIRPFEVTKSEPSPEAELLRGAQDHQTVYTVTVRNNLRLASSGFTVVDYLPAGLEFLACGMVDNSAAGTEEYPGAGRLDTIAHTFAHPCAVPSSATTVTLAAGAVAGLAPGVYTRVEWNTAKLAGMGLGTLAAGGEFRFDYVAGIPLRANVMPALPFDSTANLGNNTGPLTTDEQLLVNGVVATGTTAGTQYSDTGTTQVTAEDVAIQKSVDNDKIAHGQISTWTLDIQTSEYALSTGPITVRDVLPTGLNYTAMVTGPAPVVSEPGDGTQVLVWTLPAATARNDVAKLVFTTTTRAIYRDGTLPVSSSDSWTNTVGLQTPTTLITANDGTTSVLPIGDDSQAGQTGDGPVIDKRVSNAVAGNLDCQSNTVVYSEDVATGSFRPGDTVCWLLTVDFPQGVDTIEPVVRDFLPDGFSYVSFHTGAANTVNLATATFSDQTPTLEWDLADVELRGVFQVIVETKITSPTGKVSGDLLQNLAKLSYRNAAGKVFQSRDDADAPYIAPEVTLDKSTTRVTPVAGGDVVPYTVTVNNTGGVAASATSVRDLLPTGIVCADVTNNPDGATCTNGSAGSYLQWDGRTVAVRGSLTLRYQLTIPDRFAPGTVLTNHAGVRRFENPVNNGGPAFVHVPDQNIDPSLTPNTGRADDTAQITVENAALTKTHVTGVAGDGNAQVGEATIGEIITYTVRATVPDGTTVAGARLVDTLPAGLTMTGTAPTATLNGAALPASFTIASTSSTATVSFPNTYTNAIASGDDVVELTVTARVTDTASNIRGTVLTNTAAFRWNGGGTPDASTDTVVVEPNLTVTKANSTADGAVAGGDAVTFTVTPGNGLADASRVSTAHDVRVVDTLPVGVTLDTATLTDGGVWNAGARTITWVLPTLAPGASHPLTYTVTVDSPVIAGRDLTNRVASVTSSLAGTTSGERVGGSTSAAGYEATASQTLHGPEITTAKSVDPAQATIGETLTYTLTVTIPADLRAFDTTVLDTLPAGVTFESMTSASCSGACPVTVVPLSHDGDNGTIGFFLNDIDTGGTVVTIVYSAFVNATVSSGAVQTNTASTYYNASDKVGTPTTVPAAGSFDGSSNTADATVAIVEPALTLDKDVAGQVGDTDQRRAIPGDVLSYTVALTNTGTSPAYDVAVSDTPPVGLLAYTDTTVLTQAGGITVVDGNATDGSLEWLVAGPLAPGQTVTFTYSLTVPSTWNETQEVSGPELINTAAANGYGVPEAERDLHPSRTFREYGADDVVEVELDLASIGDTLWFDVNGDGVVDAGEPRLAGVPVTVIYAGADGLFGTADDESHATVTDSEGQYLVEHLPGGQYRVSVTQTGAGNPIAEWGLTPSYDLDGGTAAPNGSWDGTLGEAAAKRDVDFGFRGTASIGDTVWFDQNIDGVQSANEAGIPGAGVTVTWFGPDGQPGGGDDVAYAATTDSQGKYLVDGLPAGAYGVKVALSDDYPTLHQVSGPAGGTDPLDGASTLTLATGEANLDQDFGFAGTGLIGDRVWLDQNGDGVQDAGEPGLVGLTVTLQLVGPNGEVTTLTTVTDANGLYEFANLPAGQYTVTVTPPPGVRVSGDPDGGADSTSKVTLADGEQNRDQDFGYNADTLLGDTVWWDLNADGVQNAGEPGLPGVTVTATGPNGVVLTTTTGADGTYSFDNLQPGQWTVTVSNLPSGLSETFDADGLGTPNASTTTLATQDLAQDFGYTGGGVIGDTVWLDRNGDGVVDANEPPLAGVSVTLTWFGADGQPGGGDDIVLTTTTDANGQYRFDHLPDGAFQVAVDPDTLPSGVGPVFDRDGALDNTTTVQLTPTAREVLDADFGYQGTASIGRVVWLDLDGDGVQDDAEPGLSGVRVALEWAGPDGVLGTADDQTMTTVTDLAGKYDFGGLPAGDYRVTIVAGTLPTGLQQTFDEDGGSDATSLVSLAVGDDHETADFGFRGAGVVGDTVWLDLNGDGVQDAGEPGVPAQPVTLVWAGPDGLLGTADDVEFHTTTDAQGGYLFEGLPDGHYRVTVDGGIAASAVNTGDPDGAADSSAEVTLGVTEGRENLDQDFGYQGLNGLGNLVWFDTDGDTVIDAGETGVSGVTLEVTWYGPDGVLGGGDDISMSVVTDAAGAYTATGLPDGVFSVRIVSGAPAGYTLDYDATGGPDGFSRTTLQSSGGVGQYDDLQDFGYAQNGEIGDRVWFDQDRDGKQDAGEPGIGNVMIELIDSMGAVVGTTTTDAAGAYLFENVSPGAYTVRIRLDTVPAGYRLTAGTGEISVTVGAGESVLTADFPLAPPAPLAVSGGQIAVGTILLSILLIGAGWLLLVVRRRSAAAAVAGGEGLKRSE